MGFKIKNSLTGEFEKLPILTLKGEKGETGGVEEYNKVDYMGNKYKTLKQANDANVEYAVKTAIGEFNYLDYEGQHITATDTIEGRSKGAILKGQTVSNLWKELSNVITVQEQQEGTTIQYDYSEQYAKVTFGEKQVNAATTVGMNTTQQLQGNKTYYINTFVLDGSETTDTFLIRDGFNNVNLQTTVIKEYPTGQILSFTTEAPTSRLLFYYFAYTRKYGGVNYGKPYYMPKRFIVSDKLEDVVNQDFFEGMQSVKMPVLTTTGKNLFNGEWELGSIHPETGGVVENKNCIRTKDFFVVESNEEYTISNNKGYTVTSNFYDYEKNLISTSSAKTFITPSNSYFVKFRTSPSKFENDISIKFQIEQGSISTSYEPYKSNILTTSEEVELLSEKSTLNLLTGEVFEPYEKVTLNKNMTWYNLGEDSGTYGFYTNSISERENATDIICDKLPCGATNEIQCVRYGGSPAVVQVRVLSSNLETQDIHGFYKWLDTTSPTVRYKIKTPVIKTVDLSDNVVYSYDEVTHYDCSSEEGSLVPTLSVKVPTDVQATIAQQRETIQTLNSENERLNQIQEALKASMLDSQVQLMNLSWNTDFEVFALRESIAPKDFLLASRTGSNIDKFSQAKFIIENDCPDLEKLNSQIEYYFSKDVFSQEQLEELTDLISIVKGGNGCEY